MSMEELKRFGADVKENKELQEAAKAAGDDAEAITKLANEKGYDFTVEDLKAAKEEAKGELSEEQLDNVAGGGVVVEAVGTTVVVEVTVVAT